MEGFIPVFCTWWRACLGLRFLLVFLHVHIITLDPGCNHASDFSKIFYLLLEIYNLRVFAVQMCPGCLEQAGQVLLQHCTALSQLLSLYISTKCVVYM